MSDVLQTPLDQAATAEKDAAALLTTVSGILITSDADYRAVAAKFAEAKDRRKQADAERTALVKPLNDHVKMINASYRRVTDILDDYLDRIGGPRGPMVAWQRELEAQRRKAEEEARLERERIQREADAKIATEKEKLRIAQEEADALAQQAPEEMDAFEQAEAEAAEKRRLEALEATQQAIRDSRSAQASVIGTIVPKSTAAGTAFRKAWTFEVVDYSLVPRQFLIVDEQAMGLVARTKKENASIPGIRFYAVEKIGGR